MGTATDLQWNLDKLGQWSEPKTFDVARERIAAYAEATNDEHPAHRAGDLAPPVFAIVPAFEVLAPTVGGVVPGEILMRVVHGQQDFHYHRPIEPGQVLVSKAVPLGVTARSTGAVVLGKGETRTEEGELVVEQWMTAFIRGAEFPESVGEELPDHGFPEELRDTEPAAQVSHSYDPDQTQRYSEASGDPMPVHLDEDFAKAMGLPGIIVHGLCTMAFCSRAVVGEFCPDDPTRLRRLAVRFSKVIQPDETITTSLWEAGEAEGGAKRVAFETVSDNGNVAIKDGLAEVA
jgi:acyl dehydratase